MLTVSISDFTGVLALGVNVGTGAPSPTRTAEQTWLYSLIDVYEREFLRKLLGDAVALPYIAWLEQDEGERKDNEQYKGITELLRTGINPAACYVYFHGLDNAGLRASATGVHRTADEGSVNPRGLQLHAWNIMAREVRDILRLMRENDLYDGMGVVSDPRLCETLNWFGI